MRLFLGIELPPPAKKDLALQIEHIQKEYPQFDWIPQRNYHITVYFFGNIDRPESIHKRLEEILFDKESFHMYSFGLNLFLSNKITIYMSFRREKTLEAITENVKNTFSKKENDQKYVPHLSLARYKIPSKQQYFVLKKKLPKVSIDVSFKVKEIVLFESVNAGKFPVYKKVMEFPLLQKTNPT